MRQLLVRAMAVGVALAAAGVVAPVCAEEPAHEDADYKFCIRRPGAGWRLLASAEAMQLVPDAVAGLMRPPGEFYVVIVEEAPHADLDAFVVSLREAMTLESPTFGEPETLTYRGFPARAWTTDGTARGVPSHFRHLILLRGRFLYQLVGYAVGGLPDSQGRAPALRALEEHFELTEGEPRARAPARTRHDPSGVGWRVRDGRFESATDALALEPTTGWRLAVGEELREMNDSACVGLVAADPEAYVVLLSEPLGGAAPGPFLERLRVGVASKLAADGPPREVDVGGRPCRIQGHVTGDQGSMRLFHGALQHGGRVVQVQWWTLHGNVAASWPRVVEALAAVRLLPPPEAAALAQELRAQRDPQERVGPTWSLRAGVYRDFAQGFTWTKPPGFWDVLVDDEARRESPDATLFLEEPALGLYGLVTVRSSDLADAASYHRALLERLGAAAPATAAVATELPGARALVTEAPLLSGDLRMTRLVASVVHDGRAYELLLWGLEGNVAAGRAAADAAIRGLAFPERLLAQVREGGDVRDVRMGFRLRRPPGPGWRFSAATPPHVAPVGSFVHFRHERGAVMAGGSCDLRLEQDPEFLRTMALQLLRQRFGRDDAPVEERDAVVAGLPARRLSLVAAKAPLTVWLLLRGRTAYLLMVGGEPDLGLTDEVVLGLFDLLE